LVTLLEGTRIVPFDTDQELTITGVIITDDGQEGVAAFDRSNLNANTQVDINYEPKQVEVIVVTTGGSALTTEEHDKLILIPSNPLLTNDSRITMILSDLAFVKAIEGGKWEIVGSQMIFYQDDNTTEVARFNVDDVNAPTVRTRV